MTCGMYMYEWYVMCDAYCTVWYAHHVRGMYGITHAVYTYKHRIYAVCTCTCMHVWYI